MTICVHCGLPPDADCANHVQRVQRTKKAEKVARDPKLDQSIHPRVQQGRAVHAKSNTAKPKRGK
jgi:hypothetical protein